ncbi:MAG: hypothetical protein ACTSU4_10165 [Promethearchaeota archaeon]
MKNWCYMLNAANLGYPDIAFQNVFDLTRFNSFIHYPLKYCDQGFYKEKKP